MPWSSSAPVLDDVLQAGTASALPQAPPGWFVWGAGILSDGLVGLIRTSVDFRERYDPGWTAARVRVSLFDGERERDAIEVVPGFAPSVERFADGRWLVFSRRAAPGEDNARIYAADGTLLASCALGDGINHVRCAPDDTIWVGYFDEGIFGSGHGAKPIGSAGIARFSAEGELLWSFNEQADVHLPIDDCYAMTLDGNDLWTCYHSAFPIVRVRDGHIETWENIVDRASALAIDGDDVVLAGGIGNRLGRVTLLQVAAAGQTIKRGQWPINIERGSLQVLEGRGDTLHVIAGGIWTRTRVAAIRQAAGL